MRKPALETPADAGNGDEQVNRRQRRQGAKGHDLICGGRVHPDVRIPAPFRSVIDAVAAADARWFREHPGFRNYIRAVVPGEFRGPEGIAAAPDCEWVIVSELAPGLRTRRPLAEHGPLDEAARAGVTLFGPDGQEAAMYEAAGRGD